MAWRYRENGIGWKRGEKFVHDFESHSGLNAQRYFIKAWLCPPKNRHQIQIKVYSVSYELINPGKCFHKFSL
jgi:hypothetical protein